MGCIQEAASEVGTGTGTRWIRYDSRGEKRNIYVVYIRQKKYLPLPSPSPPPTRPNDHNTAAATAAC